VMVVVVVVVVVVVPVKARVVVVVPQSLRRLLPKGHRRPRKNEIRPQRKN